MITMFDIFSETNNYISSYFSVTLHMGSKTINTKWTVNNVYTEPSCHSCPSIYSNPKTNI